MEEDLGCDDFDGVVVDVEGVGVDGGEFEVVVDKESDTPAPTRRTITPVKRIVSERRFGARAELSLLQTRNADILLIQEELEFSFRGIETVDIKLKDFGGSLRGWRRALTTRTREKRRRRTRVAVDVVGEEEE